MEKVSEGYREILYFVSHRDREYFWYKGGTSIIAECITYPDEGYTEKYEELFIPENEPGVTLQQALTEGAGSDRYALVAEVEHCEIEYDNGEWAPTLTRGGEWVEYDFIDGEWVRNPIERDGWEMSFVTEDYTLDPLEAGLV